RTITCSQRHRVCHTRPPPDSTNSFYFTDAEGRLRRVVPTRRLLLSPRDTPLTEIMVAPVISIPDTATVLDACEFFTLHRLLAFPVVDQHGRMVGLVDVELYTQELTDLETREGN